MDRIADVCTELAAYRIMINIDRIMDHYTTEQEIAATETELRRFLKNLQASVILTRSADSVRSVDPITEKIERIYFCPECKIVSFFKSETSAHEMQTGHKSKSGMLGPI